LLLSVAIGIAPAKAATETVIHTFGNFPNGANPYGTPIRDAAGNLYGTTYQGGAANEGVNIVDNSSEVHSGRPDCFTRFFVRARMRFASSFRNASFGTVIILRNALSKRSHSVAPGTFGDGNGFIGYLPS